MSYYCCDGCGRDVWRDKPPLYGVLCRRCATHGKTNLPSEMKGRKAYSSLSFAGSSDMRHDTDLDVEDET